MQVRKVRCFIPHEDRLANGGFQQGVLQYNCHLAFVGGIPKKLVEYARNFVSTYCGMKG